MGRRTAASTDTDKDPRKVFQALHARLATRS